MDRNDDQQPPQAPQQPAQGEPQSDEKQGRPPLIQRLYQTLVEQRIAQAIREGQMDNLPGAGKPQRLDDDANVPEEWRTGFRILKANELSPPWIEARKDLDAERARLDAWLAEANARWRHADKTHQAKLHDEYRRKLKDLHSAILTYNLTLPPGVPQIRGLIMAEELRKLGA